METPTPNNPLGAKGIGESGTIGSTPAVQSAVVDALAHLGVRHVDMPTSPERVWRAHPTTPEIRGAAAAGHDRLLPMSVEIRPMVDDDVEAMVRSDLRAFGVGPSEVPKGVERVRNGGLEPERFVVADDGGAIVGTGGAYTMSLTVPGGGEIPMSGVTWISVAATHRRRGRHARRDGRARGRRPTAGRGRLRPARVGGLDLRERRLRAGDPMADAPRSTPAASAGPPIGPGGRFRFVEPEDVLDVLPAVHDRVRAVRAGELSRSERVVASAHRRGEGSDDGLRRVRGRVGGGRRRMRRTR